MARLRLLVAYDGGGFRGFAPNPGVRTVAGVLADALERRLGYPVQLTCAGRTDAGVHARGQVVSLDVADTDAESGCLAGLRAALRGMCGPEIAVLAAERVEPEFDARFSALSRSYRYTVWNAEVPDVFRREVAWHVHEPLDVDAMEAASALLLGEHDFASFCGRATQVVDGQVRVVPTTRRVLAAGFQRPSPRVAAFRHRRQLVLPADGALHRRYARGGRPGSPLRS